MRTPPADICGSFAPPVLKGLKPALRAWVDLMRADGWGKDAPWWYNERASVSQFAGAIWRSKDGWAFEEYSVRRTSPAGGGKRTPGRCDLMFEVADLKIVAEAKQVWLPWTNNTTRIERVATAVEQALTEVATAPHSAGRYTRHGLVFVVPYVAKKLANQANRLAERLQALVDALRVAHQSSALAWAFPATRRRLVSKRYPGRYYPGVVVLLASATGRIRTGERSGA